MGYSDIYDLQGLNGSNAKKEFIKLHENDEWFRMFMYYAMNPLLTYNISEKTIRKLLDTSINDVVQKLIFFNDIFECCEFLSRLRGIDDATIRQVCLLLSKYEEVERELYIQLLAKTLRLGVTAKTINKIIPNLIPEWEVQQAYPIEKYPIKEGQRFWLSEKLNGNRATFYDGRFIARSGFEYKGLEHIINELRWVSEAGFVLDGEFTLKDKGELSDNEAFRIATGVLNSDEENKTVICFTIFDMIPVKDFDSSLPNLNYEYRRVLMSKFEEQLTSDYVKVLPVLYQGTDLSKIDELLDVMIRQDKEGLMLNLNVPYKRTRHKGILKIKRFYTMDLPIIRCEEGSGRLKGTLGALVLSYRGNEVKVGSGFTDEQRELYWRDRDNIVDVFCEVKYKEISKDKKTGLESLQFPVFVSLRSDKDTISYG